MSSVVVLNGDEDDERLRDRQLLVLYGSETGNGQDLAGYLERMMERLHFSTSVYEMNGVELKDLSRYLLVVFVISTTGRGDIPKNALRFWKSLKRIILPRGCLRNVRFTTFGLGDSSYPKYNFAARKLHNRLEQLGAIEWFPREEADEQHDDGTDGAFIRWSDKLRIFIDTHYPLPDGVSPIPPDVELPPKYWIELLRDMDHMGTAKSGGDALISGSMNDPRDSLADTSMSTASMSTTGPIMPSQAEQNDQIHDTTAALFSHVDTKDPYTLEKELRDERTAIRRTNFHAARLSETTAQAIPGGIDTLDRSNVLRDHARKYSLEERGDVDESLPPEQLLPIPNSWDALVVENERVTPADHWQDVRHLVLQVKSRRDKSGENPEELEYGPGDTVTLYPKNFPQDVQTLIDLMDWGPVADRPVLHAAKEEKVSFNPTRNCFPLDQSTLRQLLTHNYDFNAIPKRTFFDIISFYTKDPTERERLRELASPVYSDEFYDFTSRPRRSILEVLQDFKSVKIPFEHVPSVFPVIRGREYSIASGGILMKDPNIRALHTVVELLIALVKYKTVLRKTRRGLCSRYIDALQPYTWINLTMKANSSRLDDMRLHRKPVLAIGPGTGIAPIRAYFYHRDSFTGRRVGRLVLFFGGRNNHADFYFEEEWDDLNVDVITAFSRDQEEKIYVQDRIREQAPLVCSLLKQGALVLLCGSSGKMPEAVKLAIYNAMVTGEMAPDREAAKKLFHEKTLLWEEVW